MGKPVIVVESAEWVELGERLRSASPARYSQVLNHLKMIVEGQELLAEHDDQLILRPRRPTKRYAA